MKRRDLMLALAVSTALGGFALLSPPALAQTLEITGERTFENVTRLTDLMIGPDARLQAGSNRSLTLTVDGVAVPIAPGRYRGNIVLTPTTPIWVRPMLGGADHADRTALFIEGKVDPSRSVAAITGEATITDQAADGLNIRASDPGLTGVIIQGDTRYTLNDLRIDLSGNALDDSVGLGAGVRIGGSAVVVLNRAKIATRGVIRTALFVDGSSRVEVNDAEIETFGGVLPPDYAFSFLPGKMMEVPYGLGLTGNTRSTNIQGTAQVSYNRVHIRAHGWGALSTDGEGPALMFVKDSRIETVGSGYGAYANGLSRDVFDNTDFDVTDYGLIIGGPGSGTFTNGSRVTSDRYGVMMHQGSGGGELRIEGGAVIETGSTAIQVKGRGTSIFIDDAQVKAGNGILLQTMANDDPIIRELMRAGPPPTGDPRNVDGAFDTAGSLSGPPPPPPPGGAPGAGAPEFISDILADIRNTTLKGDVFHGLPGHLVRLTLRDATLEGMVSLAATAPASGHETSRERMMEIGDVANTPGPQAPDQTLELILENGGRWSPRATSYLNRLQIAEGAGITPPPGRMLRLTVNGQPARVAPGDYRGSIVVEVQ